MKIKRRYVVLVLILGTVAYLAVYQNCGGWHERSSSVSVASSQVSTYLQDLSCYTSTAYIYLNTIVQQGNTEEFFASAPQNMGPLDLVAPLTYSALRTDGGGTPQQIYAFFAVASDGTGSLVIGLSDSSASGASPTPSTTTTGGCSNALNVDSVIAAYNDGTLSLETATFDSESFEMQMAIPAGTSSSGTTGSTTLLLRSYDVDNGDFQDTIQLEVNQVDSEGNETFLGDINFIQPD